MDYLLSAIAWIFWTLVAIVVWLLKTALWMLFWLVLPILLVAFVALRLAEQTLGKDAVRAWVKARTSKYGATALVEGGDESGLRAELGLLRFEVAHDRPRE